MNINSEINDIQNAQNKNAEKLLRLEQLQAQSSQKLNDIEKGNNEVKKAEITYEVLLSKKTEKDKYRTALLNVIKGDRINATQCQVDKNLASQKYISTLIKTITLDDGTKKEILITSPTQIDKIIREYYYELYKCQDNKLKYTTIEEFLGPDIKINQLDHTVLMFLDHTMKLISHQCSFFL